MADFAAAIRRHAGVADNAFQRAREQWRDSVADDFQKSYWRDIDASLRDFARECERFEALLRRAEDAVR